MKCRRLKNYNNINHVVNFGTWGDESLKATYNIPSSTASGDPININNAIKGQKFVVDYEYKSATLPTDYISTRYIIVHDIDDQAGRTIKLGFKKYDSISEGSYKYKITYECGFTLKKAGTITVNFYDSGSSAITGTTMYSTGAMKYINEETELIDTVLDSNTTETARVAALTKLNTDYHLNLSTTNYVAKLNTATVNTITNYGSYQDGVVDSLTQRLSIIKGEIWYQINYGLPLLDKVKSKAVYDSTIINIITTHPGVSGIIDFKSYTVKQTYYFECTINTIYNEEVEIKSNYLL